MPYQTYILSAGIGLGIVIVSGLLLRVWIGKTKRVTTEQRVALLRTMSPLVVLAVLLVLWIPSSALPIPMGTIGTAQQVFSIAVIICVTWFALSAVRLVRTFVMRFIDIDHKDNLDERRVLTQYRIFERIASFLIILIGIALCLMSFSEIRKVGISLLASAGVTGLIIGLAAQKLIAGILSGIQLAITQPIRLDDVVVVEGEWGRIEEINLTYVVVKIWDQRRLVLPTTYFIEKPFQNWTKTNSDIIGSVFLHLDYRINLEDLRQELDRLLDAHPLWDRKTKVLQVTNSLTNSMEVRVLVSAADSGSAWDLRVDIREKLIKYVQDKYPESLPRFRVEMGDA